jgi:uncharacterized protein YhfF
MTQADLPIAQFGFPGPLRDQLVGAILTGDKTSTTGLVIDYESDGSPIPVIGERQVVIDSVGDPVAVIEVTGVRVIPLAEVNLEHAMAEGEGYTSVAQWREGHESFWHGAEMRDALGQPDFTVDDATMAIAWRFRLVRLISEGADF